MSSYAHLTRTPSQAPHQQQRVTYRHQNAADLGEHPVQIWHTAEHQRDDHRVHRAVRHRRHVLAALDDEADLGVQVRRLLLALPPEVDLERLVGVDAGEFGAGRVELEVLAGTDADLTGQWRRGDVRKVLCVFCE